MTTPRSALVTGGSRGIGPAIAEQLAADGYDLTLCARNAVALGQAASKIRQTRRHVAIFAGDMADETEVNRLVAAHSEACSRLDVLVISAGIGTAGFIQDYPLGRLDKQFMVNVRAPFLLIKSLLPLMRSTAAACGSAVKIVAIASITGVLGDPQLAAYAATKSALISLCASVSAAESTNGISATAICSGYVDTDMASWVHDHVEPNEMIKASDVAEMTAAICRLSQNAVVPSIVITRAGNELWRA